MKIEQLQREARDEFQAKYKHSGLSGGTLSNMLSFIEIRVNHVYTAAIEDAKGVMPEEAVAEHLGEDPGNFLQRMADGIAEGHRDGFNEYRAEALNRLDGLLK